jgi:PIN domain nuclease of toxin-antitoxin system
MDAYTTDTHVLFRYLADQPRRLSKAIWRALKRSEVGQAIIYVPTIVLCELWMVNHAEGRLFDHRRLVQEMKTSSQFVIVSLDVEDVEAFDDFAAIPNDHDRIIAITARRLDAPLLTMDGAIIDSKLVPVVR